MAVATARRTQEQLVWSVRARRWMTRSERAAEDRLAEQAWTERYWLAQYAKWW